MPLHGANERPKILFVTSHWPLAEAYGAQQRVLNLANLLASIGDVSFVIVPTEHEDEETARRTRNNSNVLRVVRPLPIDPNKLLAHLSDRLRHELDPKFTATDPYIVSEPDRAALQELIQQHDVVWVHTIRTANWFRLYRWPHSILDADDLPSRAYQSAVQSGGSLKRRLLDLRMWWLWRRRELIFADRFDALTVCSEEDRHYLRTPERTHVIPNGAHSVPEQPRVLSQAPRIGLLGNCTYPPNEEGARWFIQEVWPSIKREYPRAELRLVGRGSDGHLTKLGPDVLGLGWINDPAEEIASWSAMIVPIKVGSGTRVKVAEGFARKCPVVATTLGAFGYDVENGREILLADRADEFAAACIQLLRDPALGVAVAERAHRRFLERWTWESFGGTVRQVVQECLNRRDRS